MEGHEAGPNSVDSAWPTRPAFSDAVYRELSARIDRAIAAYRDRSPWELDKAAHDELAKERAEGLVGRAAALRRIGEYLRSERSAAFLQERIPSSQVIELAPLDAAGREEMVGLVLSRNGRTLQPEQIHSLLAALCGLTKAPSPEPNRARAS